MNRDDLAYKPTVVVEQIYRVECDGGCGWEWITRDDQVARVMAEDHRKWHRQIIDTLESDMGPCRSCGASDEGAKLAEGRYSGLPFLYCGKCGSDW